MTRCPDQTGDYASSPCFAHELTESEDGVIAVDAQTRLDVMRWRRAERERLLRLREAMPAAERREHTRAITEHLDRELTLEAESVVSVYWPMKAEPDLRPWMHSLVQRGVRVALPVVREPKAPMVFREWTPAATMGAGIWNIPVPVDTPELMPTVMLSPVLGFDASAYRLGYGGGYFDRTLAALPARPLVIGVGFANAALASIFPLPHDMPMDMIITEAADCVRRAV